MSDSKTHYRKAFNSPYLSSADIVGPTVLTIKCVRLERDATKKTKDDFNTAHFVERELRPGEPLKPMILNATNSKTMKELCGSPFIDDWKNVKVMVYVDSNVRFGKETVDGLRISNQAPAQAKKVITRSTPNMWTAAKEAYKRDGNFDAVLEHAELSEENQKAIIEQCRMEAEGETHV